MSNRGIVFIDILQVFCNIEDDDGPTCIFIYIYNRHVKVLHLPLSKRESKICAPSPWSLRQVWERVAVLPCPPSWFLSGLATGAGKRVKYQIIGHIPRSYMRAHVYYNMSRTYDGRGSRLINGV